MTTGSLFIPVILSSAGRNQSFFTSELTLTNRGEQEARLDYSYTSRDEPERRSGTASDVLPAGRQKIETDALTYLRDLGIPIPPAQYRYQLKSLPDGHVGHGVAAPDSAGGRVECR